MIQLHTCKLFFEIYISINDLPQFNDYREAAHPSAEELHQQHSPKDSFPSQQSKNEKMSDVEEEYLKINKPYVGKLEEEDESYYSDFSILNPNSKKVLAV